MSVPAYVIVSEFDNDSLPMVLVASQNLASLKGWMRNKPMRDGEARRTLWKDHNDSVMFDPGGHKLMERLANDPDCELLGTVYEKFKKS